MINWFKKLFKIKPHIPLLDFKGGDLSCLSYDIRDKNSTYVYCKNKRTGEVKKYNSKSNFIEKVTEYEEVNG